MERLLLWYLYGFVLSMSVPAIASVAFALKKPTSARERTFILRFILLINGLALIFLTILLLGIWLIPGRWAFLIWVAYPPLMLVPVWVGTRRHASIRAEERRTQQP